MSDTSKPASADLPRSHKEAADRILRVAAEMIKDKGLQASVAHVSYEEVIKKAGVSRAVAYKLWPNKDVFHNEFLAYLAGPEWTGTGGFDQTSIDLATEMVASRIEDLADPDKRRDLFEEVVRVCIQHNYDNITTSRQWQTFITFQSTFMAIEDDAVREEIASRLAVSEASLATNLTIFYEDMAVLFGFRMREPFNNYTNIATLGAAIIEGLGLRRTVTPELVSQTYLRPNLNGEQKEWSLATLGYLAMIDGITEPDPNYNPQIALAQYMARVSLKEQIMNQPEKPDYKPMAFGEQP